MNSKLDYNGLSGVDQLEVETIKNRFNEFDCKELVLEWVEVE